MEFDTIKEFKTSNADGSKESYAWTEGMREFMERMRFKAAQIGMTSSVFVNPYGGEAFGYNTTTCTDLLRLGIHAYSYRCIMDVLSTKGTANLHVYGPNDRDIAISFDFQKDFDDAYMRVHGAGENPHIIYGGKGGGWGSGEHKAFAYLGYCRVKDRNILAVTSNVSADRSVGRLYRKNAIIEVLDICERKLNGESIEGMTVKYADYAAAAFLPDDIPSVLLKNRPIDILFSQGADVPFNPASTTKVLMAITASDICPGNQELYQILDEDICNDSVFYYAYPGDIESIETGMYPILISSNGSNTMAMARHCGEKILAEKKRFQCLE